MDFNFKMSLFPIFILSNLYFEVDGLKNTFLKQSHDFELNMIKKNQPAITEKKKRKEGEKSIHLMTLGLFIFYQTIHWDYLSTQRYICIFKRQIYLLFFVWSEYMEKKITASKK